jgi:uncharacterized protein (DUF2384 family)
MKQGNTPDESLSPEETDHVARVFALAEQVFGSRDRALNWLRSQGSPRQRADTSRNPSH